MNKESKMKTNITRPVIAATSAMAFALTMVGSTGAVHAEKKPAMEKCYGVAAKGKNDCQTAAHSCAGQAKTDAESGEWVYMPAGLCNRIAGGKTTAS